MTLFEMIITTALSAFFASLAAVAVTARLERRASLRNAKTVILSAFQRHQERLWEYANAYQNAALLGVGNGHSNQAQFAPSKPPVEIVAAEIRSVRHVFKREGRLALAGLDACLAKVEPKNTDHSKLADWRSESKELQKLAEQVAAWNMKSVSLPPLGKEF